MKRKLLSPPNYWCPAYFWYLNGKLTKSVIKKQLQEMAAMGVRNVCPHPWPAEFRNQQHPEAMKPSYLSKDYFKYFKVILEECKRLNMSCYLYDEGGWPSGSACGQVRAFGNDAWAPMFWTKNGIDIIPACPEKSAPYSNLLIKDVTSKFIQLTHEAYYQNFKEDFGKTIKYTFMDEPRVTGFILNYGLPWCPDFDKEFKRYYNYDITPYLNSLVDDSCPVEVKIDFHNLVSLLFVKRFLIPVRNWCRKHHIFNGGHFGGEDEVEKAILHGHGHIMRSLRAMDAPGVDAIWRQVFPNKENSQFPKLASSVAHQAGKKAVIGEIFAVYGNGLTPVQRKFLIDYMLVRGVNNLVFSKIAISHRKQFLFGIRPHLGPVDPLWKYSKNLHVYTSRAAWLLSFGTPVVPNAVYFDMKSIWAGGEYLTKAVTSQKLLTNNLMENQCDFDFVDDDALAEAKVVNNMLKVNKAYYQTLQIPSANFVSNKVKEVMEKFPSLAPVELLKVNPPSPMLKVCKRQWKKRAIYFVVNESSSCVDVTISLQEDKVLFLDIIDLTEYKIASSTFKWHFEPFGSAFFITGKEGKKELKDFILLETLNTKWTLKAVKKYVVGNSDFEIISCKDKAVPTTLGNWDKILGKDFSGDAVYKTCFYTEEKDLILDLGKVDFGCKVKLNNIELPVKFFPPFRYSLASALKQGKNVLEVTVSNTLACALAADNVEERISQNYPPVSNYEKQQRTFEKDSLSGGLFGPVVLGKLT